MSAATSNFSEDRLRARIAVARSYFVNADFEAYVSMWSQRTRPQFRETEEDWGKPVQRWTQFLSQEKPTSEVLGVAITGQKARVKVRASVVEEGGSRVSSVVYDYWVFENGDWFLDDADRAE